jgi:hypothetical protein
MSFSFSPPIKTRHEHKNMFPAFRNTTVDRCSFIKKVSVTIASEEEEVVEVSGGAEVAVS